MCKSQAATDCAPEVESFIQFAVGQVLTDPAMPQVNSNVLVGKLVQALESDASWVELYGITGELIVPKISDVEDELNEPLLRATEVRLVRPKTDLHIQGHP